MIPRSSSNRGAPAENFSIRRQECFIQKDYKYAANPYSTFIFQMDIGEKRAYSNLNNSWADENLFQVIPNIKG